MVKKWWGSKNHVTLKSAVSHKSLMNWVDWLNDFCVLRVMDIHWSYQNLICWVGIVWHPTRQILVPGASRGRPPLASSRRPLKILFDRLPDVPIRRPRDVMKWRSRDILIRGLRKVPGMLIRDIPTTFSARSLEDLQSTQTWMSQHFF